MSGRGGRRAGRGANRGASRGAGGRGGRGGRQSSASAAETSRQPSGASVLSAAPTQRPIIADSMTLGPAAAAQMHAPGMPQFQPSQPAVPAFASPAHATPHAPLAAALYAPPGAGYPQYAPPAPAFYGAPGAAYTQQQYSPFGGHLQYAPPAAAFYPAPGAAYQQPYSEFGGYPQYTPAPRSPYPGAPYGYPLAYHPYPPASDGRESFADLADEPLPPLMPISSTAAQAPGDRDRIVQQGLRRLGGGSVTAPTTVPRHFSTPTLASGSMEVSPASAAARAQHAAVPPAARQTHEFGPAQHLEIDPPLLPPLSVVPPSADGAAQSSQEREEQKPQSASQAADASSSEADQNPLEKMKAMSGALSPGMAFMNKVAKGDKPLGSHHEHKYRTYAGVALLVTLLAISFLCYYGVIPGAFLIPNEVWAWIFNSPWYIKYPIFLVGQNLLFLVGTGLFKGIGEVLQAIGWWIVFLTNTLIFGIAAGLIWIGQALQDPGKSLMDYNQRSYAYYPLGLIVRGLGWLIEFVGETLAVVVGLVVRKIGKVINIAGEMLADVYWLKRVPYPARGRKLIFDQTSETTQLAQPKPDPSEIKAIPLGESYVRVEGDTPVRLEGVTPEQPVRYVPGLYYVDASSIEALDGFRETMAIFKRDVKQGMLGYSAVEQSTMYDDTYIHRIARFVDSSLQASLLNNRFGIFKNAVCDQPQAPQAVVVQAPAPAPTPPSAASAPAPAPTPPSAAPAPAPTPAAASPSATSASS